MAKYTKKSKKTDPSYRRRSSSKHTPAERFLRFQVTHPAGAGETSHYLDIGRELSKINRRLYRQGMVYRIANISITSRDTVQGLVSFSTAPDTWIARNAWNRGFNMYNQMNQRVLDLQPGRKNKYADYKIYLSDDHRASSRLLNCVDNGNNEYQPGEWQHVTYNSPDGTTSADAFTAHLLGDHNVSGSNYTSVSLIKSYGEARATVNFTQEPRMDSEGDDDPLLNLFDDGTVVDEIAQNLDDENDLAPYKIVSGGSEATIGEFYPGSESNGPKPVVRRLVSFGTGDTTTAGGITKGVSAPTVMVPGFDAMCGLVEIETQSDLDTGIIGPGQDDIIDIVIELAPGSYKGVAAFDI